MRRRAKRGRNTIKIKKLPKATGRYNLRLTATTTGQKSTDKSKLTVTR